MLVNTKFVFLFVFIIFIVIYMFNRDLTIFTITVLNKFIKTHLRKVFLQMM